MMSDTIYVEKNTVNCQGPGASGGHPRIFLSLGPSGEAVCPYCSRTFILKES